MKLFAEQRERLPDERILAIEAGKVVCPRGVLVDIETCWVCPSYRGLTNDRIEGLICAAERFMAAEAARSTVDLVPDETAGK
jgi:hypothetical protein